ncbi:hypothetical protein BDN70DRAFT_882463 [Pholiota conissans]|uniref:Chromatin modification-related protein n=1 Tax=Pholiota conissans TaxID=109636 RepID=A0A9P5YXL2_9AGAR|nr:hypothetical protein BDN70DRAFT_882463 [Pholiota conissans]
MAAQAPNFEEAANVASEFIYSLDNLPNEVAHLLQEIKHRESRSQELQQEIDKDSLKYMRHSRRASVSPGTPDSPSSPAPSAKSLLIPAKIIASYAEIQELAAEKCALAERLIEIISRTRSKLDVDIAKVRTLQGEPPEVVAATLGRPLATHPTLVAESLSLTGSLRNPNPAFAIGESLRNALGVPASDLKAALSAVSPSATASTSHATKKRRITQNASIKISPAATPTKHRSASPTTISAPVPHTQPKSRLSRQVHPPTEEEDNDMDADGDEEGLDEDENDDELYCFCRKQSYGDMIACDNEGQCPYEWFHLACVGLKQPTPDKWYCEACIQSMGLQISAPTPPPPPSTTRKGRRK